MSDKTVYEDKSLQMPPKLCQQLRDSINELRAVLSHGNKHTIVAALEQLEAHRLKANKEQIRISMTQGPMVHLQMFADCLNDAMQVRAEGQIAINRP